MCEVSDIFTKMKFFVDYASTQKLKKKHKLIEILDS
jgi:hypothetical protein